MSSLCVFENISRDDVSMLKLVSSLYVKSFKSSMPIKLDNGTLTTYYHANNETEGNIELFFSVRPGTGSETTHRGINWYLIDSLFLYDLKTDNSSNQTLVFDTSSQTATHKIKYFSTGCEDICSEGSTTLTPFTCELEEIGKNACDIVLSDDLDAESCASIKKLLQILKTKRISGTNDKVKMTIDHEKGSSSWVIRTTNAGNTCTIQIRDDMCGDGCHGRRIIETPVSSLNNILSLLCKVKTKSKKKSQEDVVTRVRLLLRDQNSDSVENKIIAFEVLTDNGDKGSKLVYAVKSCSS